MFNQAFNDAEPPWYGPVCQVVWEGGIARFLPIPILFCSHFHQVEDDQAAGKNSPVVQLGTRRSAQMVPLICGSVYGLHLLLIVLGILPIWTLVSIAGSVYSAISLCRLLLNH